MKRKYIITLIIAPLVLALDQYTKWLVATRMTENQSIDIVPKFFSLHYLTNTGAAFGLFQNMNPSYRIIFFLAVGAVALGMVIYYLIQSDNSKVFFPVMLALVLGGALGNVTDRIRLEKVTDFLLVEATFMGEGAVNFLDKHFGTHYWPSFNVSDTAIVVGIIGMAIDLLFLTEDKSEKAGESEEAAGQPDNQ